MQDWYGKKCTLHNGYRFYSTYRAYAYAHQLSLLSLPLRTCRCVNAQFCISTPGNISLALSSLYATEIFTLPHISTSNILHDISYFIQQRKKSKNENNKYIYLAVFCLGSIPCREHKLFACVQLSAACHEKCTFRLRIFFGKMKSYLSYFFFQTTCIRTHLYVCLHMCVLL